MVVRMVAPVRTCGRRVTSWPPALLPLLTWLDRRLCVQHATNFQDASQTSTDILGTLTSKMAQSCSSGLGVMYLVPFDRPPEDPPDRRVY